MPRVKVFISYAHADLQWMTRLSKQLKVLELEGLIDVWNDLQIGAGEDWFAAINNAMLSSKVTILMISTDFLVSDFIIREEVRVLLDRHHADGMKLIPVLVYDCPWKAVSWLSRMQIRPQDELPLARGNKSTREKRMAKITEEIYEIIKAPG